MVQKYILSGMALYIEGHAYTYLQPDFESISLLGSTSNVL